jgi:segregation and condensation protein B
MTQEPRETSADEPQVTLETTDEASEQGAPSAGEVADRDVNEIGAEDSASTEDVTEPFEEDPDPTERKDEELLEEDQIATEDDAPEEAVPDETADNEVHDEELNGDDEQDSGVENDGGAECAPCTQTAEAEETERDSASDKAEEQPEEGGEQPPTVESVIEAILFATDEPLTATRLANIVETTGKQVRQCIKALNEKYQKNHNAFRIEQIAGGHQMLTLSTYDSWLRKMLKARSDSKLSPAAMETLAIIAYKQPVIRVDIEAIRGVAVGEVIRSLMYKGLVKIVGRAEILGRPMLYGTTKKFLEVFGLNSLKDLPKAEELKKPD